MILPEPALVQSQSCVETGPGTKSTFLIADLLDCPAAHPMILQWVIQQLWLILV